MIQTNFEQQLKWISTQMPLCTRALNEFPDLQGVRIAFSMHLEIKVLPLLEGLLAKRAQVFLTTCNPKTVRDEVVEHLKKKGAHAHAWNGMSAEEQSEGFRKALKWEPTHLCEMGADLTTEYFKTPSNARPSGIRASLEATGSGIQRLENLSPPYPIFNWDDVPLKEGLHNRRMVGLMTWNAFLNRTGLTLHGKKITVIGYGSVGYGVAQAAQAFGGSISVVEPQPERAIEASCDGWTVAPMAEAIEKADVIVTATGAEAVLGSDHFQKMKDGVFLINVGHHAKEIDLAALRVFPHHTVLPFVEEFNMGSQAQAQTHSKKLYLFSGGSMANLVAGQGDSLNAFDMILAVMAGGLKHLVGPGDEFPPGVHLLPKSAWQPYLC